MTCFVWDRRVPVGRCLVWQGKSDFPGAGVYRVGCDSLGSWKKRWCPVCLPLLLGMDGVFVVFLLLDGCLSAMHVHRASARVFA